MAGRRSSMTRWPTATAASCRWAELILRAGLAGLCAVRRHQTLTAWRVAQALGGSVSVVIHARYHYYETGSRALRRY